MRLLIFTVVGTLPLLSLLPSGARQARLALRDGHAHYQRANFGPAAEAYERAVRFDPGSPVAWFFLGRAHQDQTGGAFFMEPAGEDAAREEAARVAKVSEHRKRALEAYKHALDAGIDTIDGVDYRAETLAGMAQLQIDTPGSEAAALLTVQKLASERSDDPKTVSMVARLYERLGRFTEAEQAYRAARAAAPADRRACEALAVFYNKPFEGRSRFDEGISVLEECVALAPDDPRGHHKIATFYWDKAYRDPSLDDAARNGLADKGLAAVERALALDAGYLEAVIYKGLLYRVKAQTTGDPGKRREYLETASALQKQGLELQRMRREQQ